MICPCPDLADALRGLQATVDSLHGELRALRLARQADIKALIALHQRPGKVTESSSKGD